jgi:predicted nucleic acid-binding protein
MAVPASGRLVLLDACCLLNLHATRHVEEILQILPARFAVVEAVANETLYTRRGGGGADADEKDRVDLTLLTTAGLIEILHMESAEATSYVTFAAHLDDGEAMTIALALHRGGVVATDDRKAIRIIQTLAPQVRIHTTAELLKAWADLVQLPPPALRTVLTVLMDVRQRARFAPGRHDPLQAWWLSAL